MNGRRRMTFGSWISRPSTRASIDCSLFTIRGTTATFRCTYIHILLSLCTIVVCHWVLRFNLNTFYRTKHTCLRLILLPPHLRLLQLALNLRNCYAFGYNTPGMAPFLFTFLVHWRPIHFISLLILSAYGGEHSKRRHTASRAMMRHELLHVTE